MRIGALRVWYLLGVAVAAAAISDPLVETLANHGRLGSAAMTPDNDHASVLPAVALGALLLLSLCAYRALTRTAWAPHTWAALSERVHVRDTAWIVVLQWSAVWTMEQLEGVAAGATPASAWSWLAGPPVVSLIVHACIGAAIAAFAGRVLAAVAATLSHAVHALRAVVLARAPRRRVPFFPRERRSCAYRACERIARRIAGRAPPIHAALL